MEYLIYASLVLITLISLWALISIPKNYLFKSILVPTMLVLAISTWFTYTSLLGYGTTFKPTKPIVYHSHISDKRNNKIYVLLTETDKQEPRLHIFPYSEALKKALEKAKESGEQGVAVFGAFKEKKPKRPGIRDDGEWVFYQMPFNQLMPKDEKYEPRTDPEEGG